MTLVKPKVLGTLTIFLLLSSSLCYHTASVVQSLDQSVGDSSTKDKDKEKKSIENSMGKAEEYPKDLIESKIKGKTFDLDLTKLKSLGFDLSKKTPQEKQAISEMRKETQAFIDQMKEHKELKEKKKI